MHFIVGVISSLLCFLWGGALLISNFFKHNHFTNPGSPTSKTIIRSGLGIFFIIMGIISITLFSSFNIENHEKLIYFPLTGLIVSSSQIFLFTIAVLTLLNSRLLNKYIIIGNLLPILSILLFYPVFIHNEHALFVMRVILFSYYILQLITYTSVFFIEHRKYLSYAENFLDAGKLNHVKSCKSITLLYGLSVLYLSSAVFGIWAITSYYFTNLLYEMIFICSYTILYVALGFFNLDFFSTKQKYQHQTNSYK